MNGCMLSSTLVSFIKQLILELSLDTHLSHLVLDRSLARVRLAPTNGLSSRIVEFSDVSRKRRPKCISFKCYRKFIERPEIYTFLF